MIKKAILVFITVIILSFAILTAVTIVNADNEQVEPPEIVPHQLDYIMEARRVPPDTLRGISVVYP